MKTKIFLLSVFVGLSGSGCTLMKVAPMLPDVMAGISRTHSFELGMAYDDINAGKFPQAEATLKELEQKDSSPLLVSEIAYIRALITERKGSIDEALVKYQTVIAEHPHTPDAYFAAKKIQHLEAARKAGAVP